MRSGAVAHLGGLWAWDPTEVTSDLRALDSGGRWGVVLPYAGAPVLVRFSQWSITPPEADIGPWTGVPKDRWASSLSQEQYIAGVRRIHEHIASGEVYQVNLCRVLEADIEPNNDIVALHRALAAGNPAPYASMMSVPDMDLHVACASPELFLRREGNVLSSGPIKGTAPSLSLIHI